MKDDPTLAKDQNIDPEPLEDIGTGASAGASAGSADPSATGASTSSATGASAGSATGASAGSADPSGTGAAEGEKAKPSPAPAQTLKGAWKQVENIGQTLGEALQGRGNVVMVRVNDETLEHLDMLVEAEMARSRSEAAAMLITEGMKANQQVFDRIREITDQIAALRSQLRESVQGAAAETEQKKEDES